MALVTVGPFFDVKEAEEELEDAKREYEWCYDDGGIEEAVNWEGLRVYSIWYRTVYRPRPDDWPAPTTIIHSIKSAIQQELF